MGVANKEYRGELDARGEGAVVVVGEDGAERPLYHVVHHSPSGYAWGYGGSGPADLALSILADVLYERPTPDEIWHGRAICLRHHQDFKWARISTLPEGEPFVIRAEEVEAWLVERGVDVSRPTSVRLLLPAHPTARTALAASLYTTAEGLLNAADDAPDEGASDALREAGAEIYDAVSHARLGEPDEDDPDDGEA